MNTNKLIKPFLPVLIVASATLFISGCNLFGSDSDDPVFVAPPPVPTDGITGIWEGTFSRNTTLEQIEYKVTVLFHMPDDPRVPGRGNSGGIAFGDGPTVNPPTENPHFLFEGGYEYSDVPVEAINPSNDQTIISCEADVYALGRGGTQGTFIQEFSYELGSAAGPDQRGAGCLYLRDADGDGYINELVGEINFEEAGKPQVALTYSTENARTSSLSDLDTVGSDDTEYHLWSNDNSGTSMAYTHLYTAGDNMIIRVVENRTTGSCGGDVIIAKVADHNLFTVETVDPHAAGCNVSPLPEYPKVETQHFGLGAVVDVDGKLEFVHLMASKTGDAPDTAAATAFYNNFTLQ